MDYAVVALLVIVAGLLTIIALQQWAYWKWLGNVSEAVTRNQVISHSLQREIFLASFCAIYDDDEKKEELRAILSPRSEARVSQLGMMPHEV